MRRKLATITVAGAIALGGAALAGPALADAAPDAVTESTQDAAQGAVDAVADGVDRITEALAGLVSDGTLTQDQADEVASTLADALPGPGGPGGPGGLGPGPAGLDAAAEVLDLTPEELRDALAQDGATLASVAEDQGVSTDDLVAALVDAARAHLDEEVADGRITQEQADERAADLEARIGELVTTEVGDRPLGPGGHGPGGHGPGGRGPGGTAGEDPADGATAPQAPADDGPATTPDGTSATPSSWSYAA
ncbi:hypothetical protein WDZ16_14520 [Pseudokineococcus marinus]